jgi:hypothetical protein
VFTLVTARTLRFPPNRGIFLKCFRPFVASWPAPSASSRSESGRVGMTCWHSSDQLLLRKWSFPGWLLNSVAV